jgi:phospholipid/cholesterol/gamma-HCH transport system permease protein
LNNLRQGIEKIGRSGTMGITWFTVFLRSVADFGYLFFVTLKRLPLLLRNPDLTVAQMYTLGVESVGLVSVIAFFLGSVTVTQAIYQMSGIIPMRYLGVLVQKTMITELGPVITSMVFAGRVATGIAAEIGSMKNSEQFDAMTVLNLDPIRYLIVPKTAACIIMVPLLVIWAIFLAFVGATVTVIISVDMTLFQFMSGLRLFFNPGDLYYGILKTAVFGAIVAITGAHFGFIVKGGAQGVGDATTKAVITSVVLILIFDFLIALLVL